MKFTTHIVAYKADGVWKIALLVDKRVVAIYDPETAKEVARNLGDMAQMAGENNAMLEIGVAQ